MFLSLMACNDWLDVESQKSVTLEGYFKSEAEVESWVNAIFAAERKVMAPVMVFPHGYMGLYCDDAGFYEGFRRLEPTLCLEEQYMRHWASHYNVIYLVNTMFDNQSNFENITKERTEFWLAQANFSKAYAYFDLAREWGEAPIALGSESTDPLAKSSIKEILQEALRCAEAALILPVHEELKDSYGARVTSKHYASKGTVYTLLANIYAWMGGLYGDTKPEYWQKAEAAASEVIDGRAGTYRLEDSISIMLNNSLGKTRNSPETIFDMEINELDYDRLWASQFEMRYPGMSLINYPYLETDPRKIETDADAPHIKVATVNKLFSDPKDVRTKEYWYRLGEVTYEAVGGGTDTSEYAFINKWREGIRQTNPEVQQEYSGLLAMEGNRVVWRLADLILLRAECRARMKLASAKDDLDLIRKRAGLAPYAGSTDPETLREEIFHERERELFGEGHRYYDIVRNGYYNKVLPGKFITLTKEDVDNGALYLPIASEAFKKNVYMKQNTYWLWQQ